MDDSGSKSIERQTNIRVLSIVKGFHGGVARYTAMLSKLDMRPGIDFYTVVINSPGWPCNREDLDGHDLHEIIVRGRLDFSWIDPCVEAINNYAPDLLFVHGDCVAGGLVWLLHRKLKWDLPYVSSNHGFYRCAPKAKITLKGTIRTMREWVTPWFYQHRALGIVTVADHCKQYLVSRAVDAEKITVVHNGIDPNPPQCEPLSRSSLDLKDDDIIIGIISRLDLEKGLTYLINAFSFVMREHPCAHLVMVGDGECAGQLQQQCQRLGIASNVHFVGYQNNAQAWYEFFNIFALPSLREGHSIALLEAMRAGKAIVATDVGGNVETVRDEKEALVIPSKSAEALANSLIRLIKDRALARRLSEAAKERFRSCFTIDHMLDETEAWLFKCVRLARLQSL